MGCTPFFLQAIFLSPYAITSDPKSKFCPISDTVKRELKIGTFSLIFMFKKTPVSWTFSYGAICDPRILGVYSSWSV